jgi:hypothetical protein
MGTLIFSIPLINPRNDRWAIVNHATGLCKSVKDPKEHPYSLYRDFASGAVSSFFSLYGARSSCAGKHYLTDPSNFNTLGSTTFKMHGECS